MPNNVLIEIVSNSGHLIQTDNYDELCRKITEFVNKEDTENKKINICDELNALKVICDENQEKFSNETNDLSKD